MRGFRDYRGVGIQEELLVHLLGLLLIATCYRSWNSSSISQDSSSHNPISCDLVLLLLHIVLLL